LTIFLAAIYYAVFALFFRAQWSESKSKDAALSSQASRRTRKATDTGLTGY